MDERAVDAHVCGLVFEIAPDRCELLAVARGRVEKNLGQPIELAATLLPQFVKDERTNC
jgi:hypothetical protein